MAKATIPQFWFDPILVAPWLPEGESGEWEVRRLVIGGDRVQWLARGGDEFGYTSPPGVYTHLVSDGVLWMTDSPSDLLTHREFLERASGRVLITGLGLGVIPDWLARKDDVSQIDIVEKNPEVMELVAGHLLARSDKIRIHVGDAWEFEPSVKYDCCFHDFWLAPTAAEVKRVFSRYRKSLTLKSGLQAAWTPRGMVYG